MMFFGFRMPAERGIGCVGDVVQRIGAARVGGQAVVGEIEIEGVFVPDHVLHHGAEHRCCGEDFGFGHGREVDRLGVAAALEVEGALLRPSVLVVADQHAARIGRKRCLAGAREAEEHGGIDRVARRVVGRAMHRHHALAGQDVVEQGEDRFLVFAGVFRAANKDQLFREVERDHRFRAAAVAGRVGLEAGTVDDGEVWHIAVEFGALGAAQHVAVEQRVPGQLGDHAHVEPVRRIGATVEILDEVVAALHVFEHVGVEHVEGGRVHRLVVVPPDRVFHIRCAHHELVLGRAAGMGAGRNHDRAALADVALAALHGLFHQLGLDQVVENLAKAFDALVFQSLCRVHPSCAHLVLLYPAGAGFRE